MLFAEPKSHDGTNGTPEPMNLNLGLQNWVSVSRGALLHVVDEDFIGVFRGNSLQHLLPCMHARLLCTSYSSVQFSGTRFWQNTRTQDDAERVLDTSVCKDQKNLRCNYAAVPCAGPICLCALCEGFCQNLAITNSLCVEGLQSGSRPVQ